MQRKARRVANLGILGISIVLVLVLGMVLESGAAASSFIVHSEVTHIDATQKTTNVFSSTAGEVTCATSTQTAQVTGGEFTAIETSELKFEGCHFNFFGNKVLATISTNGCNYKIYASGTADIVCPAGKEIEVKGTGCTLKVGPQTGLKGLSYTNNGSHIDVNANLTGIKYSHSGFGCGTGSGTTATYKGEVTVEGREGGSSGEVVNIDYLP
jgi:hypothetical protein